MRFWAPPIPGTVVPTPVPLPTPTPAPKPPQEAPMPGSIVDQRGKLPTLQGAYTTLTYGSRPLSGITGVTLHYTGAPVSQTVERIAAYQVSLAAAQQTGAGQPFPAIAYTLLVDGNGVIHLCHDLGVRVWHSAAFENGVKRNDSHVGIVYTGDKRPSAKQIVGLATAIDYCETQLGRRLKIEGHGDIYPTSCPGPDWPKWRADIERELAELRGGTMPNEPTKLRDDTYALGAQLQALGPKWQAAGYPHMAEYVRTQGEAIKETVNIGKGQR
jgi:hypothetical protein